MPADNLPPINAPIVAVDLPKGVSLFAPMHWSPIEGHPGWWGLYIQAWPNLGSYGCAALSRAPVPVRVGTRRANMRMPDVHDAR